MADLPDWYTQVQGVALEASSFRSGLDADKPAAPAAGEIWLARDTFKLYVCMTAGTWTGFDASILVQGILTLYANLVAGGYKLTGLGAPTSDNDAARKVYVDDADALRLLLAGGTMSGAIAMGTNKVTGLAAPTDAADAARKTDVDTVSALLDDVSVAQPSRAKSTNYQNSTKLRLVTISVAVDVNEQASIRIGSTSPPATTVATQKDSSGTIVALVPPSWYYRLNEDFATITIDYWTEYDLF